MEIKVLCGCGSKFKFEVEPVNGRMPCRINCPTCGAEATTSANEIIQQRLSAEPPATGLARPETPPPAIAIVPPSPSRPPASAPLVANTAAAPTAPPPPQAAKSDLRVNPPVTPEPVRTGAPPAHVATSGATRPATPRVPRTEQRSRRARQFRLSWKTKLGIVFVLLLIAGEIHWKLYRHGHRVVQEAPAVSVTSAVPDVEQHVWANNSVVLTIKHTNETDIARACVDFWQERLGKRLTLVVTNELFAEENQIGVLPVNHGFVEIIGGLDWPKPQLEDLTQYLSQRFNTLALVTRDVDFSGAYLFAVFEQGAKKFRAEMEFRGNPLANLEEIVKTEGDAWAITRGHKPGKEGKFHLSDADKIAKRIGVKLGALKANTNYLLLVESGGPLPKPVLKRPIRRAK